MLQLPISGFLGHRQVELQKKSAFAFSFVSKAEFLFPIALRMQPFYLRHMPLLDVIDIWLPYVNSVYTDIYCVLLFFSICVRVCVCGCNMCGVECLTLHFDTCDTQTSCCHWQSLQALGGTRERIGKIRQIKAGSKVCKRFWHNASTSTSIVWMS